MSCLYFLQLIMARNINKYLLAVSVLVSIIFSKIQAISVPGFYTVQHVCLSVCPKNIFCCLRRINFPLWRSDGHEKYKTRRSDTISTERSRKLTFSFIKCLPAALEIFVICCTIYVQSLWLFFMALNILTHRYTQE